ncbi:hypothetical protein CS078_25885, partial [Pseudomonas prosekii]
GAARESLIRHKSLWELSLLAIAVGQSALMSVDMTPSRAGSLLHWLGAARESLILHKSLWELSLLAIAVGQSAWMSVDMTPSR